MSDHDPLPDELSHDELHLYSRQILLNDWDIEAQQRLKQSRVLLIGAGGLGCTVAEALTRAGLGCLHIVDFDIVSISNVQRQIAFLPEHVGKFKVEVLAQRLRQINPFVEIGTFCQAFHYPIQPTHAQPDQKKACNNNELHFTFESSYDLILDGSDNFATRYAVNAFALHRGIPLLSAAAIGLEGQLLWSQGQPCYQCLFARSTVELETETSVEDTDHRRCANSGVLATTPLVMASLQAHHALLYLGLRHIALKNRLLLWDGKTMQQRLITTQADPTCPQCGLMHKA